MYQFNRFELVSMTTSAFPLGVAEPKSISCIDDIESPSVGSATLTGEQAASLQAGLWYLNIHTGANGAGEIRGQVNPPRDVFDGVEIDIFPGWQASPWYDNYNAKNLPWIYHEEHDWQFVSNGSSETAIHLWDLGLGEWLYLNESTYRWQFLFGDTPDWIWTFPGNTSESRLFYRAADGTFISVP